MELPQLRYFKALAENGNLTKTAAMLYISAPSLSLSISRLEQELGTQLFDRIKGRLFLNDRGQLLLDAISDGLDAIDSAANTVKVLGATHDSRVKIATSNQTLFNGMIASFLSAYPDIYLSHSNHPVAYFKRDSLLIQYDFILARSSTIENESLLHAPLFTHNELMVFVPRGHPLSSRKSVRLEELAGERFIFPAKSTNSEGLYDFYYRICGEAGFEPNVVPI
jgi:DNA-binding transcriptional LysR family regulator